MIERAREFNAERTSHGRYCPNQISYYKMWPHMTALMPDLVCDPCAS